MSGTMQIRFAADVPAAVVEILIPELVSVGQYALRGGQQKSVEGLPRHHSCACVSPRAGV